jgi:hypothetical protein
MRLGYAKGMKNRSPVGRYHSLVEKTICEKPNHGHNQTPNDQSYPIYSGHELFLRLSGFK